jgi:hypothetical protein
MQQDRSSTSHIIVGCFIHYGHSKTDYLFVAFLKTPSNSIGYTASSEVEENGEWTFNMELERGFEIHLDKMRKIKDTFPSFSVTISKLIRESPLSQSVWLLLDRKEGEMAIFWDVRQSVFTGVPDFLEYSQCGNRYHLLNACHCSSKIEVIHTATVFINNISRTSDLSQKGS